MNDTRFRVLRVSEELEVDQIRYLVDYLLPEKALRVCKTPRKSFRASLDEEGLTFIGGSKPLLRTFTDSGLLKVLEERIKRYLQI
jgi:hypothetical protein